MKQRLRLAAMLVAVVLAAAALPFKRNDVAQLVPVEALVISLEDGRLVLDGGSCRGSGEVWDEAWSDFRNAADGTLFLGTAEHVVLAGGAVQYLSDVADSDILRPAAKIYLSLGAVPDAEDVAKYLSSHEGQTTLLQIKAALMENTAVSLPVLIETERGLRLYEPEDW